MPPPTVDREALKSLLGVHNIYGKPREEIPHEEFYPDLTLAQKLPVYAIKRRHCVEPDKPRLDPTVKLNKPAFTLLPNDEFDLDVTDQLEKIGYQVTEEFTLPEQYVCYRGERDEAISEDVPKVEYDMDEQDDQFMSNLTNDWARMVDQGDKLESGKSLTVPDRGPTNELFEYCITLIEKEWFELEKKMPAKAPIILDEMDSLDDQACCICGESECDNSNAIVYCDGCDIACHQECYGVSFIPEGQWLCRRCSFNRARRRPKKGSCLFCPSQIGAFKMTNQKKWGHVVCALWIPETKIGGKHMEPISHVRDVPRSRWKLVCYICKQKMGACIQCARSNCFHAFHVTCGRRAGLNMIMPHGIQGAVYDSSSLQAYCHKHGEDESASDRVKELRKWFQDRYDGRGKRQNDRNGQARSEQARIEEINDADEANGSMAITDILEPDTTVVEGSVSDADPATPTTTAAVISTTPAAEATATDSTNTDSGVGNTSITAASSIDSANADSPAPIGDISIMDATPVPTTSYPTWKTMTGTPLVPKLIIDKICTLLEPFKLPHCRTFVTRVARYWALKREFKRGAALIKRLNIALETTSQVAASTQLESLMERQQRYAATKSLLTELESIKVISCVLKAREDSKLEYVQHQGLVMRTLLFPITHLLLQLCDEVTDQDSNGYFFEVPEIPGYREIVTSPMSLMEIREKVLNLEYVTADQMLPDFDLMFDNCSVYNDSEAPVCVEAERLRAAVHELVKQYTEKEKEFGRIYEGDIGLAQKRPFRAIT